MKRCISLLALGVMLLFASNASASLAPDLPPAGYPVAGEADLTYTTGGTTYHVYVDWIVDYIQADWDNNSWMYIYLYQVENFLPSGDDIDEFYIQPIAGNILEHGWAEQIGAAGHTVDLDSQLSSEPDFSYNHNSTSFGNLLGEHEPSGSTLEECESSQLAVGVGGRKMEWSFDGTDGVPSQEESDTVWFVSLAPPVYCSAGANNTIIMNGKVPAPMPEPSSMLLLGMGLVGFASGAIKKRFRA